MNSMHRFNSPRPQAVSFHTVGVGAERGKLIEQACRVRSLGARRSTCDNTSEQGHRPVPGGHCTYRSRFVFHSGARSKNERLGDVEVLSG